MPAQMKTPLLRTLIAAAALCASLYAPTLASGAPTLPDFSAATFVPGAQVNNPYFPLLDALTRVYAGVDDEGVAERIEMQVVGAGPLILGVQSLSRRDRAFRDGRIVEDTFDFYAQDSAGNVWYLGEDVTNYRYDAAGNLLGTDNSSAWRAGINGALPGHAMPAIASVGQNYYQEFAAADAALDQAETTAVGLTRQLALGSFNDVLQVFESSELDPELLEFKYYARGWGLIRAEEGLDELRRDPELTLDLIAVVPEPSSWALAALGLLAVGARGARMARCRRSDLTTESATESATDPAAALASTASESAAVLRH